VRNVVPPKTNAKHLLALLRTLEATVPAGETALAPIWDSLAGQFLKRRGMVVILSDCFDNADALGRSLQHLRFRNHEILLFHVLAPEEIEFPFKHPTKFRNIETPGHEILTDTRRSATST